MKISEVPNLARIGRKEAKRLLALRNLILSSGGTQRQLDDVNRKLGL